MGRQRMNNKITRREAFYLGAGALAVSAAPLLLSNPELRSPLAQRFERPLPTAPILTPVRTDATTDYYEITQRECKMRIRS
jgi:spore coat protein A, manganese oxidase